jgi:hypothetical protein
VSSSVVCQLASSTLLARCALMWRKLAGLLFLYPKSNQTNLLHLSSLSSGEVIVLILPKQTRKRNIFLYKKNQSIYMRQPDATKKKVAVKPSARLLDQESESEDSGPKEGRFVSKTEFDGAMETFDESIKQMQTAINERQEQMAQKITQCSGIRNKSSGIFSAFTDSNPVTKRFLL